MTSFSETNSVGSVQSISSRSTPDIQQRSMRLSDTVLSSPEKEEEGSSWKSFIFGSDLFIVTGRDPDRGRGGSCNRWGQRPNLESVLFVFSRKTFQLGRFCEVNEFHEKTFRRLPERTSRHCNAAYLGVDPDPNGMIC